MILHRARHPISMLGITGLLLALLVAAPVPPVAADDGRPALRALRSISLSDHGVARAFGITYSPIDGALLVTTGDEGGDVSEIVFLAPTDAVTARTTVGTPPSLAAVSAFDPVGDRLVAVDSDTGELKAASGSALRDRRGGQPVAGTTDLDLGDVRGATFGADGTLYVLDRRGRRIVVVEPAGDDRAIADLTRGRESARRLRGGVPNGDLAGLALDPGSGHFFTLASDGEQLVEVDASGALVAVHDLAATGVTDPVGMTFAPSGDPTDPVAEQSLYVVDGAAAAGAAGIVELTFAPIAAAVGAIEESVLLNTIDTSAFAPPSPDPAGIVHLSGEDRLLVSDSEVNEMAIFAGVNLFEITRAGAVTDTGSTTSFSSEPTGLGFDPGTGRLYVSDDDFRDITAIEPGPDGRYGTADDVLVSTLPTAAFGSTDPEGVTYDATRDELVIVDGLAREVYRVAPGPDGLFDGVGETVTQFDVQAMGVDDPEGIHFNAASDTLLIAARVPDVVIEVSAGGALLRTLDISAAGNPVRAAAVTLAPATGDPSATSMYIADRGVDNDVDPNENDGRIYEMTYPPLGGAGNTLLDIRIASGSDDAEQRANGNTSLTSSDLEFTFDSGGEQIVGMRFTDVAVPPGSTVVDAWVQFQVDEVNTGPTSLVIRGEAADDPPTFASTSGNIGSRATTNSSVAWAPAAWSTVGQAGPDQRTPDLSSVVQEIVNRPGWVNGNALVLLVAGTGERTAESYNGKPAAAPLLHLEISDAPPPNQAPTAVDDSTTTTIDAAVVVDAAANDIDLDGNLDPTTATTGCAGCTEPTSGVVAPSGPGRFRYTPDAGFEGLDSFVYEICDTGGLCDTATVAVTVAGATPEVFEARVSTGSDDAEERPGGQVSLTSTDLELVTDGNRGAQTIGMRFGGVDVPEGATIASAWVQFQVDEPNSGPTNLTIRGQSSDDASTFATSTGDLTNRPVTAASTSWAPAAWTTVGQAGPDQRTPDLSSVVQEIVDRPGWASGNALVLLVTGTGERTAESYNGVSAAAPLLHVEYTSDPIPNRPPVALDDSATTPVDTPVTIDVASNDDDPDGNLDPASATTTCAACSPPENGTVIGVGAGAFEYTPDTGYVGPDAFVYEICDTGGLCDTATVAITVTGAAPQVIEVRVSTGSDDAEERTSGSVSLVSSDLELVADPNKGDQVIGIRFTGITIPAGATITEAWVQFQADEADSEPTNLVVTGHDADTSPTYTYSNGNVTSRATTTATVTWVPDAWTVVGRAGPAERTPDISAIVQEVVDRPGWSSGNAISVIVSGSGRRTAESFNGVAAAAPLIHIEYLAP